MAVRTGQAKSGYHGNVIMFFKPEGFVSCAPFLRLHIWFGQCTHGCALGHYWTLFRSQLQTRYEIVAAGPDFDQCAIIFHFE